MGHGTGVADGGSVIQLQILPYQCRGSVWIGPPPTRIAYRSNFLNGGASDLQLSTFTTLTHPYLALLS